MGRLPAPLAAAAAGKSAVASLHLGGAVAARTRLRYAVTGARSSAAAVPRVASLATLAAVILLSAVARLSAIARLSAVACDRGAGTG